ncbi:hypothetical protein L1887_57485 [Cichorium endivia]|nr:hypothetical protein L1887_57485 [Cichorium endivia]
MCDAAFNGIKKLLGGRRLKGAMEYVTHMEERERRRVQARLRAREQADSSDASMDEDDSNDPTRPDYNSALLIKAREALFLSERSQMTLATLGGLAACRAEVRGPEPAVPAVPALVNRLCCWMTRRWLDCFGELHLGLTRLVPAHYCAHHSDTQPRLETTLRFRLTLAHTDKHVQLPRQNLTHPLPRIDAASIQARARTK